MAKASSQSAPRAKDRRIDIFCFENNWSSDLRDKSSVQPVLELLREVRRMNFIHAGALDDATSATQSLRS